VGHGGVNGVGHCGLDGVNHGGVDGEAYVEPHKVELDGQYGDQEVLHEVQCDHVHVEGHDGVFH